jgi:hypothetical protein
MTTTTKITTALVVALLLPAARALAQQEQEQEQPGLSEPPPAAEHHGPSDRQQVLAGDLAAVTLFVAGGLLEGPGGADNTLSETAMLAALGGYLFNGPVVHAMHGDVGRSIGSLALRAALPVAGAYIGVATANCKDEFLCGLGEAALGFLVGGVTAAAIDATLLSTGSDDSPVEEPRPRLSIAPRVAVTPQLAFAGLGGTF